jgi:hypothetical protein
MTSFSATRLPSRQTAAKVILADVTIVMAGSSPAEPPQSTVSAVSHSTFSRLDMPDAAKPPEFTPAQAPGQIKPSLPGVTPSDIASDNAVPTSVEPSPQPAFPPLSSQVASFLQSAVAFVGDGLALVDDTEYRRRLDVCRTCDRRAGKRCTACGCWIGLKARSRAFNCPLARWQ